MIGPGQQQPSVHPNRVGDGARRPRLGSSTAGRPARQMAKRLDVVRSEPHPSPASKMRVASDGVSRRHRLRSSPSTLTEVCSSHIRYFAMFTIDLTEVCTLDLVALRYISVIMAASRCGRRRCPGHVDPSATGCTWANSDRRPDLESGARWPEASVLGDYDRTTSIVISTWRSRLRHSLDTTRNCETHSPTMEPLRAGNNTLRLGPPSAGAPAPHIPVRFNPAED